MEPIPKGATFVSADPHWLSDERADQIMRTRLCILGVEQLDVVDLVHFALVELPTEPDRIELPRFRTYIRHWRN